MKKRTRRKQTVRWVWVALAVLGFVAVAALLYALLFRIPTSDTSYCANSISCIRDLTGDFESGKRSTFMGRAVSPLTEMKPSDKRVLGAATGEKHIYVDLTTQTLSAYEGSTEVMSFPVSTGWWNKTPTGTFRIWIKLRYTHMEGGDKTDDTYYNLYNVPYVMYFYNDQVPKSLGFSLHGAYWHDNFGHPMSHGCVNIRPEDAAKLYDWADPVSQGPSTYAAENNPGTLVTITGTTPTE